MKKKVEKIKTIKKKREKRRSSLKFQIMSSVVALVFVIVVLFGVISAYLSYQSAADCLEKSMVTTANTAAKSVSNGLSFYTNILKELGKNYVMSAPFASMSEKLAKAKAKVAEGGMTEAYIIDVDGIANSGKGNFADQDFFTISIQGQTYMSTPMVSEGSSELIVMVSAPIWKDGKENSTVAGVIAAALPATVLYDTVADIKVSEAGYTYIIDKNGYTIADPDMQNVMNKENIEEMAKTNPKMASLAAVHTKVREGKPGFDRYTYSGVRKFLAYSPIGGSDGWSVCVNAPEGDFTGGVTLAIYISIGTLILFIIAGIAVAVIIATKIANPITAFVGRLAKLSEGDVTSPVPQVRATSTEISLLKDSLDQTLQTTGSIIGDISYMLDNMANGDFSVSSRASERYHGDYQSILHALEQIKSGLSSSFFNILQVADQVSSGSAQVSVGAQSLAQGATEQASSIQELSASINEIARHVKKNAEDANRAKVLTEESGQIIAGNVHEMEQARRAMEEISSTSRDISKVIKAIDDIAFQTNILALNAAVEAARAGAAGKGFAVVADEVRNLSQKSAEAAKNTTALIESSIAAVEKGAALVAKTSAGFEGVAAKSTEVTGIIQGIATQAQEQSAAVSQISTGVEQVAAVVQVNSATSEESAAASEELSSQAMSLKALVGRFRLATEEEVPQYQ